MDSFELNKVLGAILGTCLILLVTNFTASALFAPKPPEKPGYEIAVKEAAPSGGKEAAPAPSEPIEKLLQTASVEKGVAAAKKCAACHTFEKGGTWTDDDLNKFITNPKGFVPGTAMGFAGISKDSERADVIAYLHTLSDNPVPLPTASK